MGDKLELQVQTILQQLSVLNQNVTDIRGMLVAQNEKLVSCVSNVERLQKDNELLQEKVKNLETQLSNTESPELVYNEVRSRLEREKNVIIIGVDENPSHVETIRQILNTMASPNTINIQRVSRIGKPNNNKARPIKVELATKEEALLILRNKRKIPNEPYPNIKFKNDRTPKQIAELSRLYRELAQRKEAGENVIIKYINNQPRIVETYQLPSDQNKRLREEDDSPKMNQPKQNKKNYMKPTTSQWT